MSASASADSAAARVSTKRAKSSPIISSRYTDSATRKKFTP